MATKKLELSNAALQAELSNAALQAQVTLSEAQRVHALSLAKAEADKQLADNQAATSRLKLEQVTADKDKDSKVGELEREVALLKAAAAAGQKLVVVTQQYEKELNQKTQQMISIHSDYVQKENDAKTQE